jgi:hypothetical protein
MPCLVGGLKLKLRGGAVAPISTQSGASIKDTSSVCHRPPLLGQPCAESPLVAGTRLLQVVAVAARAPIHHPSIRSIRQPAP